MVAWIRVVAMELVRSGLVSVMEGFAGELDVRC